MAKSPLLTTILLGLVLILEVKALQPPPTITPPPKRHVHRKNLYKRGRWVNVCPEGGKKKGCYQVGVDDVLTEPEGHYIPVCDVTSSCEYVGYIEPTAPITGTTSYVITSTAGGDSVVIPLPVPPPEEPVPFPPITPPEVPDDSPEPPKPPSEPDQDDDAEPTKTTSRSKSASACSLVTITASEASVSSIAAQLNGSWLESVTKEWGTSLSWLLDNTGLVTSAVLANNGPQAGQAPICRARGVSWYSPTSWCECESSTFPELSSTKGQTGANCGYRTLPATQMWPKQTASPPTNIPGVGGVPGCAYVIYGDGQACPHANYCNCGGTPAPLITEGTSTHCNYETVPSSHCPPPTTTLPPTSTKKPAPQGTLSCYTSVAINTASVANLVSGFCQGGGGYAIGDSVINAAQPRAKKHDVPNIQDEGKQKANDVGATLRTDASGCKTAAFDLKASASACSSYFAQITDGCQKKGHGGIIKGAGCFDWDVSGFVGGCPSCVD